MIQGKSFLTPFPRRQTRKASVWTSLRQECSYTLFILHILPKGTNNKMKQRWKIVFFYESYVQGVITGRGWGLTIREPSKIRFISILKKTFEFISTTLCYFHAWWNNVFFLLHTFWCVCADMIMLSNNFANRRKCEKYWAVSLELFLLSRGLRV